MVPVYSYTPDLIQHMDFPIEISVKTRNQCQDFDRHWGLIEEVLNHEKVATYHPTNCIGITVAIDVITLQRSNGLNAFLTVYLPTALPASLVENWQGPSI